MQRYMMLACAAALASVPSSAALLPSTTVARGPFVFVGTPLRVVPQLLKAATSSRQPWLGGMGLPDNLAP